MKRTIFYLLLFDPVLFLNLGSVEGQRIQNLMEVTRRFSQPLYRILELFSTDIFREAVQNFVACRLQLVCQGLDGDNRSQ